MSAGILNAPTLHSGYKARHGSPLLADSSSRRSLSRDGSPIEESRSRSSSSSQRTAESNMNLKTVRRIDGHVSTLLQTVPQVAVYKYIEQADNWERTSMEGTLFIYSRSSPPNHGFVVLNRLSSDNLHQLIPHNLPVHVQNPFVLFKRDNDIYGLCFTDESTCGEVGLLLSSLSQLDSDAPLRAASAPNPSSSSSSSSSSLNHQTGQDSLGDNESSSSASMERLTPSPSDMVGSRDGRDTFPSSTSSPQQRKEQARKVRGSTSRRSSEPATTAGSKKTGARRDASPTNSSSKAHRGVNSHKRLSPQPGQTSGSAYSPKVTEKNRSVFSPVQTNVGHSAQSKSTSSPSLVKKLFTDSGSGRSNGVETHSAVLQSLFAQVTSSSSRSAEPSMATTTASSKVPPLRAVSLAEVEKQMSMEVPSPEATSKPNLPFRLPPRSTVVPNSDTQSTPASSSSSSPFSSSFSSSSSSFSSSEQQHVLIQPAMFSSSSDTVSHSLLASNSSTTQSPSVHMTVQPPTPVAPNPPTSHPADSSQAGLAPHLFPSVPPLVHSPGMRAAPISSSKHTVTYPSPVTSVTKQQRSVGAPIEQTDSSNLSPVLARRTQDGLPGRTSPQLVDQTAASTLPPTTTNQQERLAPSPVLPSTSGNLMAPGMFQQRSYTDPLPPSVVKKDDQPLVAGLTRSQLQQALLHLIQTDDGFVDTLHKAYIDSLRVHRS